MDAGFRGELARGVAASDLARASPATFLVGPDGRIVAKNLCGPALKEAVRNALKDDRLFSAAKSATRPPRFPVTRYEAETKDEPTAGGPAVVVLDDCDPEDRARPVGRIVKDFDLDLGWSPDSAPTHTEQSGRGFDPYRSGPLHRLRDGRPDRLAP
jgi:hypothetical protein